MDSNAPKTVSPVPLESVLCTEELFRRPSRPPDYAAESRALNVLAEALADSPQTILQMLVEITMELCDAGSAGVSLLNKKDGEQTFFWPAIAGAWKGHVGGGTPRGFSPCGVVLDRNAVQLFTQVQRYYPYFVPVLPPVSEALLTPFYVGGKAVGTVWAVAHDDQRKFDGEDMRLLVSVSKFASSAYQVLATEESLRDADRHKTEFLAMLAHELRNPLAPIQNAIEIKRLAAGDKETIDLAFQMMERQVSQMVRLVDDLLDVSRISLGKIELRKGQIELASVVHHAVEAARTLIEGKQQELTVTLPSQPVYLNADPMRLPQVVGNLLNNASKFTGKGGHIWLTVEIDGEQAVLRVRDTGIGIAADQLRTIFDMFKQVDTSLDRSISGLGIGLALAKTLVEMHGGTLEAHSAGIGHGTEFVVHLPTVVEACIPPSPKLIVSKQPPVTARRILVVDDNRDSATSLAMLLKLAGNETHTAYDGVEAVEKAATVKPDVLLLDIGLPKLNGYEAARKIRKEPWGKSMLLLALTGWGQEEDREKSREAGFNGHLVKPVDYSVLVKLLADLEPVE